MCVHFYYVCIYSSLWRHMNKKKRKKKHSNEIRECPPTRVVAQQIIGNGKGKGNGKGTKRAREDDETPAPSHPRFVSCRYERFCQVAAFARRAYVVGERQPVVAPRPHRHTPPPPPVMSQPDRHSHIPYIGTTVETSSRSSEKTGQFPPNNITTCPVQNYSSAYILQFPVVT